MATTFSLTAKTRFDMYEDVASIGDAIRYQFDCTAWQEDNANITSATWTVEYGQAAISGQAVSSGVVSALVTFSQAGKSLISILLSTASGEKKKIWLLVLAKDKTEFRSGNDGYGA